MKVEESMIQNQALLVKLTDRTLWLLVNLYKVTRLIEGDIGETAQ